MENNINHQNVTSDHKQANSEQRRNLMIEDKMEKQETEQILDRVKKMAHDINNVLTLLYSESYLEGNESPSDYLVELSNLVKELSNISKEKEPRKSNIKLPFFVSEVVNLFHRSKVSICVSALGESETFVNRISLFRILLNLITNAVEAVENQKNPRVDVIVSSDLNNDIIEIRDNGQNICNPLSLYKSTKGESRGLGMSIIREEIEKINGKLMVSGNKGMVFTVVIPKPSAFETVVFD